MKRKKSKRKKRSKTPTKLKWADEVEEGRLRFVQWLMPFIMDQQILNIHQKITLKAFTPSALS